MNTRNTPTNFASLILCAALFWGTSVWAEDPTPPPTPEDALAAGSDSSIGAPTEGRPAPTPQIHAGELLGESRAKIEDQLQKHFRLTEESIQLYLFKDDLNPTKIQEVLLREKQSLLENTDEESPRLILIGLDLESMRSMVLLTVDLLAHYPPEEINEAVQDGFKANGVEGALTAFLKDVQSPIDLQPEPTRPQTTSAISDPSERPLSRKFPVSIIVGFLVLISLLTVGWSTEREILVQADGIRSIHPLSQYLLELRAKTKSTGGAHGRW